MPAGPGREGTVHCELERVGLPCRRRGEIELARGAVEEHAKIGQIRQPEVCEVDVLGDQRHRDELSAGDFAYELARPALVAARRRRSRGSDWSSRVPLRSCNQARIARRRAVRGSGESR